MSHWFLPIPEEKAVQLEVRLRNKAASVRLTLQVQVGNEMFQPVVVEGRYVGINDNRDGVGKLLGFDLKGKGQRVLTPYKEGSVELHVRDIEIRINGGGYASIIREGYNGQSNGR